MPDTTTLTKNNIIRDIAKAHGTSQDAVRSTVDAFLDTIVQALDDDAKVSLPAFGTFEPRHRAARKGRNPQTGETVEVAASKGVGFKPAANVKKRLND